MSPPLPKDWISPRAVLRQVAAGIPAECLGNVVVIGSLAAGCQLLGDDPRTALRTKDVDCMLSPRVEAVAAGRAWTERLFDAGWTFRRDDVWAAPGSPGTPDDELPAVRMNPPTGHGWFVELLTVPESTGSRERQWLRLETSRGDFGLPSFRFLSLVNLTPVETPHRIRLARVEMMALANLLEHPTIGAATMSGAIGDRSIKRSNKDLGRVLALVHLSDDDVVSTWPQRWEDALVACFADDARALAARAGSGLRLLLDSPDDLEEARHSCEYGLLAASPLTTAQLRANGLRLLADGIEPLEKWARR